ncbi:MAG: molecular chaperone TorD family protein, partial [Elusimicrobia bacterium]|nr:molecular chaperone TorD family protein [Elusimicrobiota bacterium]
MNSTIQKLVPSYRNVTGYRAISIGFLYPTEPTLQKFTEVLRETLVLKESSSGGFAWNALQETIPLLPDPESKDKDSLILLQQDHFRLFGSSPTVYADLAFYFSDNPFEQSKKMADMAGFLRAFGVETQDGNRVDSIPIVFEFLSYLHLKWLHALEKGLDEKAEVTEKAILSYANDFLVQGVGSFYKKLLEQSQ